MDNVNELAERLYLGSAEHSIPITDKKILNVTTSIGVATYPEHGNYWEQLLKAADDTLYHAKDVGQ